MAPAPQGGPHRTGTYALDSSVSRYRQQTGIGKPLGFTNRMKG